jgi:yecA family protein
MSTQMTAILDEQELNELRDYLVKQKEQQEGLNIEEAQGYIAGIICSPEIVHPSLWISDIFNGPAEFESDEHEQRIISYLCRLYNHTVHCIQNQEIFPEYYYPAHPARTEKQVGFQAIQEWCRAFVMAAMDDDWIEIRDFQLIIFPLMASRAADDDAFMKEYCAENGSSVEDVRQYFLPFITSSVHRLYSYLAQVKHHADIAMLEDSPGESHGCQDPGCGTVH